MCLLLTLLLLSHRPAPPLLLLPLPAAAPPFIQRQAVTAGANPIAVKKGIDKTQEYLVGKLRENAQPVQGRKDIKVWAAGSTSCRSGHWLPREMGAAEQSSLHAEQPNAESRMQC